MALALLLALKARERAAVGARHRRKVLWKLLAAGGRSAGEKGTEHL